MVTMVLPDLLVSGESRRSRRDESDHGSVGSPEVLARGGPVDDGLSQSRLAFLRATRAPFGEVMDRALGEPLARARDGSRVLAHQLSDTHAPALQSIVEALELTEGILRDVIEFVRSGAPGEMSASRRSVNLRLLCERVIDEIQRDHPARAITFDSDPRIEGEWDPDAVAALFTRLLVNAVEHGATGPVRVRLRGLDDRAVLDVWSPGPLPPGLSRQRVFEPFQWAGTRRSDGVRGAGLGLYLASQAARAHQGRIDVTSTEREGTTFRVTLPREDFGVVRYL